MRTALLVIVALAVLMGTAAAMHMSEGRAQACGERGCKPCGPHEWAVGVGAKAHGYWETYRCVDSSKFRRR